MGMNIYVVPCGGGTLHRWTITFGKSHPHG